LLEKCEDLGRTQSDYRIEETLRETTVTKGVTKGEGVTKKLLCNCAISFLGRGNLAENRIKSGELKRQGPFRAAVCRELALGSRAQGLHSACCFLAEETQDKKMELSLSQVVGAHRVVRRRGSHIF
jgi:hypothetical protein